MVRLRILTFTILLLCLALHGPFSVRALGACTGTAITWTAGSNSTSYNTAGNWSPANVPNVATEDVIIASAAKSTVLDVSATVGCVTVQSGVLRSSDLLTLTVTGELFDNEITGGFNVRAADTAFTLDLFGSVAQTFKNIATQNNLKISNLTTVTSTGIFDIRNSLTFGAGATGTLDIQNDVALLAASTVLTIPAGKTLKVSNGAILSLNEGVVIAGTLEIAAGSAVIVGNGKSVVVNSGGVLKLNGASENVATLTSTGTGSTYTLTVNGNLNANYFRIERMVAAGMNVGATGTIQAISNGEFHYPPASGYAVTLAAGSTIPATMTNLGFYNDNSVASARNFNANAYTGVATTISNWNGAVGGAANETDTGNKIGWGAQASTKMNLTNNTPAGNPINVTQTSAAVLFGTFSFSLNQADTATDVTSITFTMSDTGASSDIASGKVFRDAGTGVNCVYEAAQDTQIGTDIIFHGNPPTATITVPAGVLTTSSDSVQKCVHLLIDPSSVAYATKKLRFGIASSSHVSNSTGYSFNGLAGPPVTARSSTISGDALRSWQGDSSQVFNTGGNWTGNSAPTSGTDCRLGTGTRIPQMNANGVCQNAELLGGGTLDFNSLTTELAFYALLDVDSTYTFTNATSGVLAARGSTIQSVRLRTAFPGNFVVANTGIATAEYVDIDANSTINGNVTISAGTLRINPGFTLTVLGNITVQTGGTLEIAPGGTLKLTTGSTVTVNTGGTLSMVGTSTSTASMTSTLSTTAYNVIVNGTIKAQYYSFDHLAAAGVSIETGATIDATYHLQNGSFAYPVSNSTTMLRLKRQVPTNTMNNMQFAMSGSTATGTVNVNTTTAAAGTLTITTYSGDISGPTFHVQGTYLLSWAGATNTINITRSAAGPASINAGQTYNMGRFSFTQAQAGASFVDANLTSLTLNLTGTAGVAAVTSARLFYDALCNSTAGTQIASGTFTGSPGTRTFTIASGSAVVQAHTTTPPTRCLYVEFDVASSATDAATLGVQITSGSDVVNDQSYGAAGSITFPLTSGTPATIVGAASTDWVGTTSTNWFVATNWTAGVPSATVDCNIATSSNPPNINGGTGTARCKTLTNSNGTITLQNATSAALEIYGNYVNTGTLIQNDGSLVLRDGGVTATTQTVSSTTAITNLTFNKTVAGGSVSVAGTTLTLNGITFPVAGSNFTFIVPSSRVLILPNGLSLPYGTFEIQGGGEVRTANTKTITVNGGTFKTTGVNDAAPQSTSNKGTLTISGAGTWAFLQTSGTSNFTGFIVDSINTEGLKFTGGTLQALDGGKFNNLSTTYASVKAIQLDLTAIPATATNIGWNWGPTNTVPFPTDAFNLVTSTGCGSNTITFNQWFGDFYDYALNTPNAQTKTSAVTCTITIGTASSPVSLTSLSAVGYDSSVALTWETGSETNHQGFNVYRSVNPLYGYIQVNSELIRNDLSSTSFHGKYRYLDEDVVNDVPYYYLIEDVAFNGAKQTHGPVTAFPSASQGTPPADDPSVNQGVSVPGAGTGNAHSSSVANSGVLDLGNGAHVVAQTSGAFRIEIVPPTFAWGPSAWNGTYDQVHLPGYSTTLDPGKPELLERTLLVQVKGNYATAAVTNAQVIEATPSSHLVQPAPSWAANGSGILVASYNPSAPAYALNADVPSAFYEVSPGVVTIGTKKFVKIHVQPLLYNASTHVVREMAKVILDVKLDGATWTPSAPSAALAVSPSAVEGSLRIRYSRMGMYELTYDQMEDAGVEGPFAGQATSGFRLYRRGREIPMDVRTNTGTFSSGDSIRFWAEYYREVEDDLNEVVLSRFSLGNSSGAALRAPSFSANPASAPASPQTFTFAKAKAEQDHTALLDLPLASLVDRFFWKRISTAAGAPSDSDSFLDFDLDLPGANEVAATNARVKVYLRARTIRSEGALHHVGLWVNSLGSRAGEASFTTSGPTSQTFTVPMGYLVDGTNHFRIEAIGDTVPSAETELIDVDRIEVEYAARLEAREGVASMEGPLMGSTFTLSGFDGSLGVALYDVSSSETLTRLTDATTSSSDGGVTQDLTLLGTEGSTGELGYRIVGVQDGAFLAPAELALVSGFDTALKSTSRRADLIVIGDELLLDEARTLIQYRESQGIRVITATPEQIYAEFSHGQHSSRAIKDFLLYAKTSWTAPAPEYLLFLGDASYDPRNRFNQGNLDTMPMPLEKGTFVDFGSDHWFAEDETTHLPLFSVGRVPTRDPGALKDFIAKVIAYEAGTAAPTNSQALRVSFVSDEDFINEKFLEKAQALGTALHANRPDLTPVYLDRGVAVSDAAMKASIVSEFGRSPLLMAYVGHGAEDLWGTGNAFTAEDALTVTNLGLPIVVGLDCLNAYFYETDPNKKSLGENLILNPSGGAAAFLGFTTMTVPTAQLSLQTAFQNELTTETNLPYHEVRLGDLQRRAKQATPVTAHSLDAVKSFSLLGDPTMRLPRSAFLGAAQGTAIDDTPSEAVAPAADAEGGGCGRVRGPMGPVAPQLWQTFILLLVFASLTFTARKMAYRERLTAKVRRSAKAGP